MQKPVKTEVIKLDNNNGNLEDFFHKIRSKVSNKSNDPTNSQNNQIKYDITFIVKHEAIANELDEHAEQRKNIRDYSSGLTNRVGKVRKSHKRQYNMETESGHQLMLQGQSVKQVLVQNDPNVNLKKKKLSENLNNISEYYSEEQPTQRKKTNNHLNLQKQRKKRSNKATKKSKSNTFQVQVFDEQNKKYTLKGNEKYVNSTFKPKYKRNQGVKVYPYNSNTPSAVNEHKIAMRPTHQDDNSKRRQSQSSNIYSTQQYVEYSVKENNDQYMSDSEQSQMQSQEQEITNEQLQKHISRSYIHIFPNIDVKPKALKQVQQKILSTRSINSGKRIDEQQLSDKKFKRSSIMNNLRNSIDRHSAKGHHPKDFVKMSQTQIQQGAVEQTGNIENKRAKKKKTLTFKQNPQQYHNGEWIQAHPKNTKRDSKNYQQSISSIQYSQKNKAKILSSIDKRTKAVSLIDKKSKMKYNNNPSVRSLNSEYSADLQSLKRMSQKYFVSVNKKETEFTTFTTQQQFQVQNHEESSQLSNAGSDESINHSIFIVENKLNDAINYLERNQISNLQDFLYDFKDKYTQVINTRVQIKWRLLMAHCKENKKQYERAAINYNQVIEMSNQYPKSLTINSADVYHRLAVCYTEIKQFNKGIIAFTSALNRYKKAKDYIKYSECMNNLGSLYMAADSLNQAERCFIISYDLKKAVFGKSSSKLITSLFNLLECNTINRNFDQSEKVICLIQEIILKIPDNTLFMGGLYRRVGKMYYMKGDYTQCEEYYLKCQIQLGIKYPYCMEYGELMANVGLLKIQQQCYNDAKQYFDKALMLLNFYYSKDSNVILTLKKNMEFAIKKIQDLLAINKEKLQGGTIFEGIMKDIKLKKGS